MKLIAALALCASLSFVSNCQDKNYILAPTTNPNGGGSVFDPPNGGGGSVFKQATIEYRVNGNAISARIRHSNSQDGLTQVTTTLPFIVNLITTKDSLFLSLEATPSGYSILTVFPFMSVQIFVDGDLFREATTNDFFLSPIAVSGTWRR